MMADTVRINKLLSERGFCSLREADRLIEAGRVCVDERPAAPGDKAPMDAVITVDGKAVDQQNKKVLLLFNKPRGIVCSTRQQRRETTVTDYLHYPLRIYPIGRLDKDSEGLLLLTNEGELVNEILRARNFHEKEYFVTVDKPITEEFLLRMRGGVRILDQVTRPCIAEKTGKNSFRIILTQGLNRQIRRMCEALGYRVLELKRVRIMNLKLNNLRPGEYREITREERQILDQLLKKATNSQRTPGGKNGSRPAGNKRTRKETE